MWASQSVFLQEAAKRRKNIDARRRVWYDASHIYGRRRCLYGYVRLVKPSMDYAEQILSYKREFLDSGDEMHGTSGLHDAKTAQGWIALNEACEKEETVPNGWVPADTYLCIREQDNHLVGMINIRHRLTDYLLNYGGHIGYSVRKSGE